MPCRKLEIIVPTTRLEAVEQALHDAGAGGVTVTPCKGYGEYANLFRRDKKTRHVKIEVYTSAEDCDVLREAVMDAAHTGTRGDGLVVVVPLDSVYRIRTRQPAEPADL